MLLKFDQEWNPTSPGEGSVKKDPGCKTEEAATPHASQPAAAVGNGQSFFPDGRRNGMPRSAAPIPRTYIVHQVCHHRRAVPLDDCERGLRMEEGREARDLAWCRCVAD